MRIWIRTAMAAALASAVGLGASMATAAGPGCREPRAGMHGMHHRMNPENFAERADRRIAGLEQALAIRPDQRAAWDDFASVLRANAHKAAERMKTMHEQQRPANAIERMRRIETFGEERLDAMRDIRGAAEALYAKLDAAQKQTFDEKYRTLERSRMGRWGGRHGGAGRMGPADDV